MSLKDAFLRTRQAALDIAVERADGELSVDELVQVVNNYQAGEHNTSADGTIGASPFAFTEPGEAYVVAVGDAQAGKLKSPTEELIGRLLDYIHKAVEPLQGRKVEHIHLARLTTACEKVIA